MIAIKNGKIFTITKGIIENGIILVDEGKIVALGKQVAIPSDAEVIDATGKVVIPGMIDAHAHVGVFGEGVGWAGEDGNELTEPVTPHLRAIDALHPEDIAFRDIVAAGVTAVATGPGSGNVIGGQIAVVKTVGKTADEMVLIEPAGMKMALGENPKKVYGLDQQKPPSTRMGNAGTIREALVNAQNYIKKWQQYAEGKDDKEPERDLKMEALEKVIKKETKVHIHCHRADDIMTAIRIAEEFDLDVVLVHATEGYKVANQIARRGIPCIVGPMMMSRTKVELKDITMRNPALLAEAGVKVAIQTDDTTGVQWLPIHAALAVKGGMGEEEALKAITINPAEIIGVADRVGSLEEGKDADIVIMSGHPFDFRTKTELVLVNGEIVYRREEKPCTG